MAIKDARFSLNVTGAQTGETFRGDFVVKLSLSYADRLRKDQLRREYLGSQSPELATSEAVYLAGALAECQVRIVESPAWWRDSRNGLDLVDEVIVVELYQNIVRVDKEAQEALQKKGAEALEELRKERKE